MFVGSHCTVCNVLACMRRAPGANIPCLETRNPCLKVCKYVLELLDFFLVDALQHNRQFTDLEKDSYPNYVV